MLDTSPPNNTLTSTIKGSEYTLTKNEISGTELLSENCEQVQYLINGLIPTAGQGCLAGGSDIGKSSLLRQIAVAISTGQESVLGFNLLPIHKSVLCVCTEDDKTSVSYLLRKQAKEINSQELNKIRFIFQYENLLKELDEALSANPVDLLIIDCFADAFGGDLKDTQQIRLFLSKYQKLITKHNCYVLWLHHTSKRTENLEPSKNNLLAGQGFEAKMRLVIELRADIMNPNFRHLCIVKGNYLPSSMKKESHILQFDEASLTFLNTGERTPFELLARSVESDNGKAKWEQAKELKDKGYSYEKIAEVLGYNSKGTISKLFDKATKQGWDK